MKKVKFLLGTMMFAALIFSFNACTNTKDEPTSTTVTFTSAESVSVGIGGTLNFTVTVKVDFSVGSTTFDIVGLPSWVTATTGTDQVTLSGAAPVEEGTFPVTITATNNNVSATQNFTIKVGGIGVETVLYSEDFGNAATQSPWPAVADYTGYTKGGIGGAAVTYTSEGGTVSIRNNQASSGYTGASGNCNAMAAAAGATLLINDIATCGATNLVLSFGSIVVSDTLVVSYKINGTTTWIPISYTKNTSSWGLVENLNISLPTGTNTIKLKFAAAKTQYGTRVDDITITTTDAVGTPIIDPDGGDNPHVSDPDPVASLFEDFEGFTAGSGFAYFDTQTDNKGWFGYSTIGTLQPDVRAYNNNQYVQFSAHRNSGVNAGDTQEMWLVSPRLDVSAAASKILSFDMATGYYNAGTIFKVYVFTGDGHDPTTASKTEIPYTFPIEIPASSYSDFMPSGDIDLSSYSGVVRIAFYYKGTSGSGNSTTYQLDNFAFGSSVSTLSVSTTSLSFVKDGETKSFTVTSNTTWNAVSSDPTNFSVSVSGNTVNVTATENTDVPARTATITVTTTDGTVSKTVNLTQAGNPVIVGDEVFLETFNNVSGTPWTASSTALTDYSSFDNPGWTGNRVYPAGGIIKMGTASALGSVTTPSIDLSANGGNFTLVFKSLVWYNDTKKIKVYVNDTTYETEEIAQYDSNNPVPAQEVIMNLSGGTANTKITFEGFQAANGRFYLDEVSVYQ